MRFPAICLSIVVEYSMLISADAETCDDGDGGDDDDDDDEEDYSDETVQCQRCRKFITYCTSKFFMKSSPADNVCVKCTPLLMRGIYICSLHVLQIVFRQCISFEKIELCDSKHTMDKTSFESLWWDMVMKYRNETYLFVRSFVRSLVSQFVSQAFNIEIHSYESQLHLFCTLFIIHITYKWKIP